MEEINGRYPIRCKFFAHKFVRLLQKSCAAMDIGQDACLLLCYIAHTEDAARYSGPVRYWNEQLMTVMGFKSPKQLNEARKLAEDAGWLVYERLGNRQVGRYWVKVPHQFEGLDDTVIEPNHSVNHSADGMNSGTNDGMNKGRIAERISDGSRNEKVTESGKPSIPIPNPSPNPEEAILLQLSEEVRPSVALWIQYKNEKGQRYKPTGLKALVSRFNRVTSERGALAVTNAIEKSMAANWQGWENGLAELKPSELPASSRIATDDDLRNYTPTGMFE
jgi:hypothetical protein